MNSKDELRKESHSAYMHIANVMPLTLLLRMIKKTTETAIENPSKENLDTLENVVMTYMMKSLINSNKDDKVSDKEAISKLNDEFADFLDMKTTLEEAKNN